MKISWARSFKASGIYRRLWSYGELHKAKPVKVLTHRGARIGFLWQHYRKYLNNLASVAYRPRAPHEALAKAKRIINLPTPVVAVSGILSRRLTPMSLYRQVWPHRALAQARLIVPGPRAQGQLLWHPYRIYLHNLTR